MSTGEHVRVCPVCDRENAPELARCACGAALAGVDFSLRRPAAAPVPQSEPAAAPQPKSRICPHPDCAQPNAAESERCVYCNRPLRVEPTPATAAAAAATTRPLPSALRDDYRVIDAFPATGSEADLLLVEHLASGERCVAKLYRKGLAPDLRLLALLSQADGDYVVRVRAHGVSDGVAYEVQEYLPYGTLRQWLATGPRAVAEVRCVVEELADALNGIHARRILHRDLKPENVLVRNPSPLELALSDFGIASLREATQHFTGGARTAKYAAPEALTGVLDDKSDWWALGMIAFEAATGRHPFDGLSEQVINHHLATRPIDVRGIYDDRLRALCRGLLLRDPRRRWGGAEIARWLAGDPSLIAPEDDGPAIAVRPYRIGEIECTNGAELAVALARNWEAGAKDLARGQIARWIEHELHDHNLLRKLRDIMDRHGLSDDMRLLRFLLLAVPDLPPIWRGAPVSERSLLDAARTAANDDAVSSRWLDSIAHEQVLARFAECGHDDLAEFDRVWREGWTHFRELWKSMQAAELKWRKQLRPVAGDDLARVPDVDDMLYAAPLWQAPVRQERFNGPLLLALFDAGFVESLRNDVISAQGQLAGLCPWFDPLPQAMARDSVAALVAHEMLPQAREDAETERKRQGASRAARDRAIAEMRAALHAQLDDIQRIVSGDKELRADTIATLFAALERFQQTCHQALSMGYAERDYLTLSRGAEKLSGHALSAHQALARCEELQGMNAILLRPERLGIAGIIATVIIALRIPWLILSLVLVVTCIVGWVWYRGAKARHAAKAALRWLQLHRKTIDPAG